MGIFLVTVKKKCDFSSNIHVFESKKALGLCKFMDKGHEIVSFNKLAHIKVTKNVSVSKIYLKLNILIKFKRSCDTSMSVTVNWLKKSNFLDNLFIPNFSIIYWPFPLI